MPPRRTNTDDERADDEVDGNLPANRAERRRPVGPALLADCSVEAAEQDAADVDQDREHHEEAAIIVYQSSGMLNPRPARRAVDHAMPIIAAPQTKMHAHRGDDHDDESAHRRVHQRDARRRLEHARRRSQAEQHERHPADPDDHGQQVERLQDRVQHGKAPSGA